MGDKAILVISGQVHLLNVGQTREGVKLISLEGNEAVVEFNGQRQGLNLGSSPSRFSGSAQAESSARKIILTAMDGGHFVAQGLVNGRNSISFLVDTGATFVTLSQQEATRLGLDLTHAPRVLSQTANGQVVAYRTTLESIRIQDVIIYNVDATVIPAPMPFSLLGNSFLTRFQMNRENDRLTLEKRL
ncbi:MAG: TIGR02281 family clan AA aspartic protease [Burkholderiales bacterium]